VHKYLDKKQNNNNPLKVISNLHDTYYASMSDDELSGDEGRFLDAHSDEYVTNESHHNVTINENTTTTISALTESRNLAESSTASNGDSIKFKITGTSITIKRKTKTSPVWTYFQHFDLTRHEALQSLPSLSCKRSGQSHFSGCQCQSWTVGIPFTNT
jgi:hypothetical protein